MILPSLLCALLVRRKSSVINSLSNLIPNSSESPFYPLKISFQRRAWFLTLWILKIRFYYFIIRCGCHQALIFYCSLWGDHTLELEFYFLSHNVNVFIYTKKRSCKRFKISILAVHCFVFIRASWL